MVVTHRDAAWSFITCYTYCSTTHFESFRKYIEAFLRHRRQGGLQFLHEIEKHVAPEEPLPERPSSSSGLLRRAGDAVISTGTALAAEIIRDPENRTRVARWLLRRTIG